MPNGLNCHHNACQNLFAHHVFNDQVALISKPDFNPLLTLTNRV